MQRFISDSAAAVQIVADAVANRSLIKFLPRPGTAPMTPLTVHTAEPFRGPGCLAFTVSFPVKDARTAVGFTAQRDVRYMKPDYRGAQDSGYVSMGGAGFIYPAGRSTGVRYGLHDSVRCQLDWATRQVSFSVNGQEAGTAALPAECNEAYAAVSSEGGEVHCDVVFESAEAAA